MSDPQQNRCSRIRPRDDGGEISQPHCSASAQSASGGQGDALAAVLSDSDRSVSTHQPDDVQPLPEHLTKKPRFNSACDLNKLAVVELQLCLQFLDTGSKLKAARCSRSMLHAANDPFAWRGPSVSVSSATHPQLGSLIRQSLLRHAPIALTLAEYSVLPVAEVAAIPRLRELLLSVGSPADVAPQLLALPALQGLQILRVEHRLPLSTMRLLSSLPALHTLECCSMDDSADWSWLPAMRALTDLDLSGADFLRLSESAFGTVGQCAQLQSLRLRHPLFAFARLCATPALRQLRHWELDSFTVPTADSSADALHAAFSSLAGLESLHLHYVHGVDLLLPHLAHAPALRTLIVSCQPDDPFVKHMFGSTIPSRQALRRLLIAAPLLGVRLEVPASITEWRAAKVYNWVLASEREEMDNQYTELQPMCAELERVSIVAAAVS